MESSFGKEIEIKLRDTGLGMSQEQMDRLFEPFNSSRAGGTGLGMAIVYQIITDHQGTISVTSGPQTSEQNRGGTEITIRLPIRETPPSVTGKTGAYEKADDVD
jgi:signal transduction histidine kinase